MGKKGTTLENDLEYLRQVSSDIDFNNDDYMSWIAALRYYFSQDLLYALAPVQIGIPKRIIYFKNTTEDMNRNADDTYDESEILINSQIISTKGHTILFVKKEECYENYKK